ncbi:hypothetical protein A2300_04015 [Candidatus Falkowbacteria bacterium RIFOXYB2_FULL_35_7]|uniref:10 kDa chaperonin n=1 Tax=Candidatus Falkowbacteria bacterium RIFOXYC2_FULL_36_12 TaxID=1798002 RepID=A0A1F5T1K5_9BACT|nr:MAG: hypothetical protein A2300_04015 [Candidatus Falkowbacteria bacterium RIFOXYB2_FULL_35_7]OGF32606.1 MAG: hypothetical protein A2478_00085 [Candidatus Falkowbacteria bacterium RIFOXYC2_FULL_36_12]
MIKPFSEHLLIEVLLVEQKTESGIILGYQQGQSEYLRDVYPFSGVIKAKGKDTEGFEVGEEVIFMRWGLEYISKTEGIIDKKDIVGKLENKKI